MVVGSGPAGSTAAYCLAKQGVDTLLIEKESLPRDKTCGGAITEKTLRLNNKIFGEEFDNKSVINSSRTKFQVNWHQDRLVDFESLEEMYFTRRREYDYHLFSLAEGCGVDCVTGDGVREINFRRDLLKTQSGDTIGYNYLFAADGINSLVRNQLIERTNIRISNWSDQLAIGVEAFVSYEKAGEIVEENNPVIFHLGVVEWGYGWIFPHRDRVIIGVGGLQTMNKDIRRSLFEYGDLLGLNLRQEPTKGHPFPLGNFMDKPARENVLFLGDAGGYADPLTGEGIYYAQKTALLATEAYLKAEGRKDISQQYIATVQNDVIPNLIGSRRLRFLVYGGPACLRKYTLKLGSYFFQPNLLRNMAYNPPLNLSHLSVKNWLRYLGIHQSDQEKQ